MSAPPGTVRRLPLVVALLVCAVLTALAFQVVQVRSDLAAFLPPGRTPASRFMLRELQSGSAATIILLGIEGAPAAELARLSAQLAAALPATGRFTLVSNGQGTQDGAEARQLFDHRTLLSPATTADAFTEAALHADLGRLLAALRSSASPLAVQFGLPDPVGAFPALAGDWKGAAGLRSVDGVWFAPHRDRALLVAQTRAPGMDIQAQDKVVAAIRAAFAAVRPGPARLLLSGPAVFAQQAAAGIRADILLISLVSGGLVLALLLWRFRSLAVLAAIGVPMSLSIAAAALVVQAVFGFVHGIALGFGMTMLGITLDYPVLLIGHRKAGEPAFGTLRRIGCAFVLAVGSAALGLTGMVFSGFPGLAQLGLFAATGVLTAALVTGLVLPRLIVAADLHPVWAGDPGRLLRIERWRAHRAWALLPAGVAAAYLAGRGGPRWETDIGRLSPVPPATLALDAQLRREIGAPDLGDVLVVSADSADGVLAAQEALRPRLARIQAGHAIVGFDDAARLLPSAATQRARQAALPDAPTLSARLAAAAQGLPFKPDAFDAFLAAVAAARTAAPVTLATLDAPGLAARLRPLLFERDGTWYGPITVQGARTAAVLAPLTGPGAMLVDTRAETNSLVAGGAARAGWWLAGGIAAALLAMLAGLGRPLLVARIALAIGSAMLVTVAVLTLAGVRLSLVHLVALQLTVGVGLDYALFFARRQLDEEERARTLRTLVTCCGMTLLSFGLLTLCSTPLLQAIGATVAIGAVSAMCFAFLLVGPRSPNA